MKIVGMILLLVGIVGTVMFGIQALQDSETFSIFGMDIAVSKANWTPVIISGSLLVIGLVLTNKRL